MSFDPVLDVHDEILTEREEENANRDLEIMMKCMVKNPPWAGGFPLAAEGFTSKRFVKSAFSGEYKLESKHF